VGLGLLAAGCGGGEPEPPPSLPALSLATTLLRFPHETGYALAYEPDSLAPIGWQSAEAVPGAALPLGIDLDQRIVYYLDTRRRLVGLDLEARVARSYVDGVRLAVVGPDGAAYTVDSTGQVARVARRATATFPARFSSGPASLFGTLNGQVVAVTADSLSTLRLLSVEQSGDPIPVEGTLVTATYWGELIAAAREDRVELLRPAAPGRTVRVGLPDEVTAMAFSPSGHRLYAATRDGELITIDRFHGDRLAALELPGAARELRIDPAGRWLLVRPPDGDSTWVADLATGRVIGAIPTDWRPTLPAVAGAATLLATDGADLVAWNLAAAPPAPTARVARGAHDEWLAVPWAPPQRSPTAIAEAESALAAQDSAIVAAFPAPFTVEPEIFLQVSSTQNPAWAEDLARQLQEGDYPAQVWRPTTAEESYRVVIGPYGTRDEAEEVGRRLGRPFFVVTGRPRP
jgi:hypothetical protein